jgi:hypothetical protein
MPRKEQGAQLCRNRGDCRGRPVTERQNPRSAQLPRWGPTVAQPVWHEGAWRSRGQPPPPRCGGRPQRRCGRTAALPASGEMGRERGRGREETAKTRPRRDGGGGAAGAPPCGGCRRLARRRLGETEREQGELRACVFFPQGTEETRTMDRDRERGEAEDGQPSDGEIERQREFRATWPGSPYGKAPRLISPKFEF